MAQTQKVILRARQHELVFPRPALMMGIVNVTPDSFSDGGCYLDAQAAIEHALALVEEGAEIIDLGGESTRPNALPVNEQEELRRIMPVFEGLAGRLNALISIDTSKPAVAREALEAGAAIVNDVGASHQDPRMWELVAEHGAAYVVMHMQGTPRTMQQNPAYANVVNEVGIFFEERLARLSERGVAREQVILDAGIGFGKRREHNLVLLGNLASFARFGRPLLVGVSRKSFLGRASGEAIEQRLPAALACSCWAVQAGAQILRTHDVGPTLRAVRMAEALRAVESGGDSESLGGGKALNA
jgi:dihydropteroate synthase